MGVAIAISTMGCRRSTSLILKTSTTGCTAINGQCESDDVSYKSGVALPSTSFVKWGDAFVDPDNDGWVDVIAVSGHVYPQVATLPSGAGYQQPGILQLNQKDGTFCDASQLVGPDLLQKRVSRGLAVGDLSNDGQMDVVIEDIDGAPRILRNRGVASHHWVSFELAGTKSNRLAICPTDHSCTLQIATED